MVWSKQYFSPTLTVLFLIRRSRADGRQRSRIYAHPAERDHLAGHLCPNRSLLRTKRRTQPIWDRYHRHAQIGPSARASLGMSTLLPPYCLFGRQSHPLQLFSSSRSYTILTLFHYSGRLCDIRQHILLRPDLGDGEVLRDQHGRESPDHHDAGIPCIGSAGGATNILRRPDTKRLAETVPLDPLPVIGHQDAKLQ